MGGYGTLTEWLRLFHGHPVRNESQTLTCDITSASDLPCCIHAPHAGVRTFRTIYRVENRTLSQEPMGVPVFSNERADNQSALADSVCGSTICNGVGLIDRKYPPAGEYEPMTHGRLVSVPVADDVSSRVDNSQRQNRSRSRVREPPDNTPDCIRAETLSKRIRRPPTEVF